MSVGTVLSLSFSPMRTTLAQRVSSLVTIMVWLYQPYSSVMSLLRCQSNTGWSYGLNGKLAKAPLYDTVKGFEKENNGLFPIHVRIDRRGFVWVNLEATETPSIKWESRFEASDTHPRLEEFNMEDYVFDHAWNMNGEYNWKACVDNYNEVRINISTAMCCLSSGIPQISE
jgi:hypothetical protein